MLYRTRICFTSSRLTYKKDHFDSTFILLKCVCVCVFMAAACLRPAGGGQVYPEFTPKLIQDVNRGLNFVHGPGQLLTI